MVTKFPKVVYCGWYDTEDGEDLEVQQQAPALMEHGSRRRIGVYELKHVVEAELKPVIHTRLAKKK